MVFNCLCEQASIVKALSMTFCKVSKADPGTLLDLPLFWSKSKGMETVSLTSQHQITIPSKVRRSLNLHKGDRLSFDLAADGSCVVRKVAIKKSDGAARAYIGKRSEPLSDGLMREAIKKGAFASHQSRGG